MHINKLCLLLLAFFITTSFTAKNELIITSSAFSNKGMIPSQYTCEGHEMSPPLKVGNIPPQTQTLALIVHDPDAPIKGGFTHWVVWNLPPKEDIVENFVGANQGMNGGQKTGYAGMCPPTGTHRYYFRVYALDTKLDLSEKTGKAELEQAMKGHIIAQGGLLGMYKKIKG